MSLAINPSLLEKKIFTTSLPFPDYQAVGYTDEGNFLIGKTAGTETGGVILESNNGTKWTEINYPASLGGVIEFGSNVNGDALVMLASGTYFLSNIKNGSPYTPLLTDTTVYLINRLGYFSYIDNSIPDAVIFYKQFSSSSIQSYTVPNAAGNRMEVTKSFFSLQNLVNNFSSIYYTRSNWWGNYGTKNLFEIPGFTKLNSPIFEAKDITGNIQTRNLAFAFANDFTKILKINPSSTSVEPVFELIDCITPIPTIGIPTVKSVISNNGEIWVNWGNPDNQKMLRLFSPNFGGEWFNLSSLDYSKFFGTFYSSANGRNQLYSRELYYSSGFNPVISINYGR